MIEKSKTQHFKELYMVCAVIFLAWHAAVSAQVQSSLEGRIASTDYNIAFDALSQAKSLRKASIVALGLKNDDYGVKCYAIDALIEMNIKPTVPFLITAWSDLNFLGFSGSEGRADFDDRNVRIAHALMTLTSQHTDQKNSLSHIQMEQIISSAKDWVNHHKADVSE